MGERVPIGHHPHGPGAYGCEAAAEQLALFPA